MTPVLVALAVLVTAGGVVAVSAREPRFATLGAFIALTGSAYVADPLPSPAALAARLVGAVLATYLVWVALRRAPAPTAGWHVGWPGAAALAIVAFLAGWFAAGSLGATLASVAGSGAGEGPTTGGVAGSLAGGSLVANGAIAASISLVALAAAPVLIARDVLRLGLGLLLLVGAAGLVRNGLATGTDGVIELALATFTALAGAAVAGLVALSLRLRQDLELRTGLEREPPIHHRPADEAHPRRLPADAGR